MSVGWASDGERHEVLALLGESQTTVAVTARIGDGSMGEVHRARDTKLDRAWLPASRDLDLPLTLPLPRP